MEELKSELEKRVSHRVNQRRGEGGGTGEMTPGADQGITRVTVGRGLQPRGRRNAPFSRERDGLRGRTVR